MTAICRSAWHRSAAGLGLTLLIAWPVAAQEAVDLTLEQAVAEAVARNPSLAVERREIDIARGTRRQAGIYPYNPELEVEGGGGVGRARGPVESDPRRSLSAIGVGVSQTIWLQGQRGLRVRAADAGLLRAEQLAGDARRLVLADVVKAYGDLLVDQDRLRLAQELLALARQVSEAAVKQFEADAVPQLDVLRANVEVAKAENRVVAEERALALAQRELALLLGRPARQPVRAAMPSIALPSRVVDEEAARSLALESRPDLKAALAGVEAARAEIALIRAERFLPEVKVGLRYETANDFDSSNQRGLLTLSVPLPLFNRRDGDLQRAEGELAKQQAQAELARRRIDKEVSVAVQQASASRQIVERYAREILPAQERNFQLLREAYQIGEIKITDVFVGQREFVESREAYLDAVATLNTATAELYRATSQQP